MKKYLLLSLLFFCLILGACKNENPQENEVMTGMKNSENVSQIPVSPKDMIIPLSGIIEPKINSFQNISAEMLGRMLGISEKYIDEGCMFTERDIDILNFMDLGFSILTTPYPEKHVFIGTSSVILSITLPGDEDIEYFSSLQIHSIGQLSFEERIENLLKNQQGACFENIEPRYINSNYKQTGTPYWIYKIDDNFVNLEPIPETLSLPKDQRSSAFFTGDVYSRYSNFGKNINEKTIKVVKIGLLQIDEDTNESYCYIGDVSNILIFFWTEITPNIYYSLSGYDLAYLTNDGIACPARVFDINETDGTSSFFSSTQEKF